VEGEVASARDGDDTAWHLLVIHVVLMVVGQVFQASTWRRRPLDANTLRF